MRTSKVIMGILAGSAVSVAIRILFVPSRDAETRRNISEKRDGYVYVLGSRYNEIVKGVTQQLDTQRRDTGQRVENVNYIWKELEAEMIADTNHM